MPIVTGGRSGQGDFFGIGGTSSQSINELQQYDLYVDHWNFHAYHSTSFVTPDTWNQVVMTYDGNGSIAFDINGQPAGFATESGSPPSLYSYDFSSYVIGGNTIGGTTTQNSFDGLMHNVEIYNYVLSAGQVANLYQTESISNSAPAWSTSAGGSWNTSGNWSTNSVPNGGPTGELGRHSHNTGDGDPRWP